MWCAGRGNCLTIIQELPDFSLLAILPHVWPCDSYSHWHVGKLHQCSSWTTYVRVKKNDCHSIQYIVCKSTCDWINNDTSSVTCQAGGSAQCIASSQPVFCVLIISLIHGLAVWSYFCVAFTLMSMVSHLCCFSGEMKIGTPLTSWNAILQSSKTHLFWSCLISQ